jgi:hypothetical protein
VALPWRFTRTVAPCLIEITSEPENDPADFGANATSRCRRPPGGIVFSRLGAINGVDGDNVSTSAEPPPEEFIRVTECVTHICRTDFHSGGPYGGGRTAAVGNGRRRGHAGAAQSYVKDLPGGPNNQVTAERSC